MGAIDALVDAIRDGIVVALERNNGCVLASDVAKIALEAIATKGYAIVPIEPTARMISEEESAASFGIGKPTSADAIPMVWEWMLAAAPKVTL